MAVRRISCLRDCGVFRDFTWPSELPDFGRYNLIYGWNGTGKTTISRVLRCLETKTVPTTGEVMVRLGERDVPGEGFPEATVSIRVFNREFVQDNVFPSDGGDLPPIFVLGKESVEKQKEVDRLKTERTTAESNLASTRSKKQRHDGSFGKFGIDRAKAIKDTLRSGGTNPYNNYDKSDYQRDAERMLAEGDVDTHRLGEGDRDKLLAQHHAIPKPQVQEVTYALPDFKALAADTAELLSSTVVSAAIQTLRDDPSLSQWTREGLVLHRKRKADRCLFCEQPLPAGRLATLEAHFSAQYELLLQRLDLQIGEIRGASQQASELSLPNRAELYDDLGAEYDRTEARLLETVKATRRFLDATAKALADKKNRLYESISFDVGMPAADSDAVECLNNVIRNHNQSCDQFQARVEGARQRLALDMIAADLEEFVLLREAMEQADRDLRAADLDLQRLTEEITRLEREIVEHRRSAEELNTDLRKYLGHDELLLEIKETGYAITRNGVPALALSEGEMTAIALLDFLKSLQDQRFDLAKGVVVLDDPVSSLDANALYLAFGFIRERTNDAGQLFVLTHNFTFFRQVRNWFHNLKGQKKKDISQRPARFYMLECDQNTDGRCADIRRLDPLLERYESEYHYLFARVYRASTASGESTLEENYVLPNMARRLLEAFLAFRRPQGSGELWKKVQAVPFDEAKKLRILRFLHTHSHSGAVGEPEHDPSVLAEGAAVLQDLLEMIRSQDDAHFSAMVQLMVPPESAGEGE